MKFVNGYLSVLCDSLKWCEAHNLRHRAIELEKALSLTLKMVASRTGKRKKVIFIGNGGSAAIASHMAIDFWKNGRMRAVSFNDPSQLTCLANDLGYEDVFAAPIKMFAEKGDVLFAISSSGRSANILNAVKAARKKGCWIVTLSGFKPDNPLRRLGDVNFYIRDRSYGIVESAHSVICHYILDSIMGV